MSIRHEVSYGIIPLKMKNDIWYVLLVQLHAGHWGFPKGHPNPHETPLETAQRELFEETGLKVNKLFSDQTLEESYVFKAYGDIIHKKVKYYTAQVEGKIKMMEEEIKDFKWVPLSEAADHVTFDQAKEICRIASYNRGTGYTGSQAAG